MALIIEDGTIVPNANSYETTAAADAYWAARGFPDWAGAGATEADKDGFMIQAADWLNSVPLWRGTMLDVEHSMALPTSEIDVIPYNVKQAQFILAKEAKDKGGLGSPFGERLVTSERKKLDGLGEKEVHYAEGAPEVRTENALVTSLLQPFVHSAGIQTARITYG